jgi:hypothetical protein
MLSFTREFAARLPRSKTLTGHLSFDFMVRDGEADQNTIRQRVYAIECNPRTHTAVVLFADPGEKMAAMVQGYISSIPKDYTDKKDYFEPHDEVVGDLVVPPQDVRPRYWAGHDLVCLFLRPALRCSLGKFTLNQTLQLWIAGLLHMLTWKEGSFEIWDPVPTLVLYHVYWPLRILSAWWQGVRWSTINVSTTKMFRC